MLKEETLVQIIHAGLDDDEDEAKVSTAQRLRKLLKLAVRICSFNWWCVCCCRRLDFPLRTLIFLCVFESSVVVSLAIFSIANAYDSDSSPSRGVFFPSLLMMLLVLALWTFLISSVQRENAFELVGANILSFITCGCPMYMMLKTSKDGDSTPPSPPALLDTTTSRAERLERVLEQSRGDTYLGLGVSACIVGAAFVITSLKVRLLPLW